MYDFNAAGDKMMGCWSVDDVRQIGLEVCTQALMLQQEMERYQAPMLMIQENWESSKCPRCSHSFYDYEECDDGYYDRAYSLERCPYCGQKIKWSD